jgi:4-hydroxy-tetrahydrodipicolinate reductase
MLPPPDSFRFGFSSLGASLGTAFLMTRILIHGAKGRMGQALRACVPQHPDLHLTASVDIGDDLEAALRNCDVAIDFSVHSATPLLAQRCAAAGKAMVIGTTGLSEETRAIVTEAAWRVPAVLATNFSTGVNTLFWLTRKAAEILGPDYDLEVVEMHHRNKQDAPSGTARTLAEILAEVRGLQLATAARHGRSGLVGARSRTEIGLHAVRGGDVVGDHTVMFAAPGERLELTHKATSRDTLAHGALRAAGWVVQQPPGLYDMLAVLGLK